ncbi:hypothetical protein HAX54_041454 [Datura stramonium]|uniref:RRM domain-containing protein n=1 Tax=Datura stramonium TaxID=4076 RepID=A0ABS8Y9J7_DATST|nr:hypothetical protein [Datura stramonium]
MAKGEALWCMIICLRGTATNVEYRCFIGGLAWATTDQTLGEAFSQFGDATESKVNPVEAAEVIVAKEVAGVKAVMEVAS